MLSLPISRFGSQIIQPLFHLLVFFVTLLHLSLAPLYLATATSLSLSFPLSLTPPLFRLCPPFLPPTPLCRCASCVMSQGLISGGQPLSRWQPEQQLPGGWARGWWWWGGWLQCCCISRWKWARRKENQLSAACYVLPVWATVWHTQAAFSAVRFLLCCRGCCVCDGSDLWNLHSRTPPPLVPEMTSLPSHLTYFYHGSLEETVSAGIAAICGRDSNLSVCSVGLSGPVMQPHERCLEKETQPPTIFAFETSHWLVIILIYFVCIAGYEAGPFNSHPGFSLCAFTVWLWARGHRKERTLKTETSFRQSEISHKTNFYNYHTIVKSLKSKWHLVQNTHTHKHVL